MRLPDTEEIKQMSEANQVLTEQLNNALALEMRAEAMYAHCAAYVKGIYRLHLKPYFEGEATESFNHANTVRNAINQIGGVAVTDRDPTPIVHTTDYQVMLKEELRTEEIAAETYKGILDNTEDDQELYDLIEQIYFAEVRSMEELNQLI